MRPGRQIDVTTLPADPRPARRFRVQPTIAGVIVTLAVVLFMFVGPQVADPDMAGFVWAAALGVLLVGAVWPCVAVRMASVRAGGARGDPVPGAQLWRRHLRVGESTSVPVRLGPRSSEVTLRWVDSSEMTTVNAGRPCDALIPLTAVRRGRFRKLTIWVESDAPFGIVRAARAVVIELDTALEVGPRRIPVDPVNEIDTGLLGELATTAAGHGGDTTRSVRPYVSGDPAHLVHWPTSARTGDLVVREMEPPADRAVAVVVDLGGAPPPGVVPSGLPVMPTTELADGEDRAVEGAVARAAAVVAELRARGTRVLLCTAEPEARADEVGDDAESLSRLAGATFGEPAAVPPGWSVLRITPRGDDV